VQVTGGGWAVGVRSDSMELVRLINAGWMIMDSLVGCPPAEKIKAKGHG
jgi:hypothetical protein